MFLSFFLVRYIGQKLASLFFSVIPKVLIISSLSDGIAATRRIFIIDELYSNGGLFPRSYTKVVISNFHPPGLNSFKPKELLDSDISSISFLTRKDMGHYGRACVCRFDFGKIASSPAN